MAQPPDIAPVLSAEADGLGPRQAAHEAAAREVDETMLNIEVAIRRADRARKEIARSCDEQNYVLALTDAIAELERTRKTLRQKTFYAGPQQRLI